jgi:CheY-like chemotaxis protein
VIKVLVVEDNPLVSEMMCERLRRRGFDVLLAEDGRSAVTAVGEHRPDVVLMDLGLPVMDGRQASVRLKAAPETRDIPIIAVTAWAFADGDAELTEAPWDDFEAKPADFGRLVEKIRYWAGRALGPIAPPVTT